MKIIYKYPLVLGHNTFSMRHGAKVVFVGLQLGQPMMWVECDPSRTFEERYFRVFGTGWDIDELTMAYVGTWIDNQFVWHLYESR